MTHHVPKKNCNQSKLHWKWTQFHQHIPLTTSSNTAKISSNALKCWIVRNRLMMWNPQQLPIAIIKICPASSPTSSSYNTRLRPSCWSLSDQRCQCATLLSNGTKKGRAWKSITARNSPKTIISKNTSLFPGSLTVCVGTACAQIATTTSKVTKTLI